MKTIKELIAGVGIGLFAYGAALDFYRRVFWEGGAAALTLPEKLMFFGFGLMLIALVLKGNNNERSRKA